MTTNANEAKRQTGAAEYGVSPENGTVRLERLLPGPIERVWAYLTESEKRGKWLAEGAMEPRPGSSFELRFYHSRLSSRQAPVPERYKDGCQEGVPSEHKLIRWEPPRLLVITWGSGADGPSEVTFELSPRGNDVLLVLTHRRLTDRKATIGVAAGWHTHLAVLIERLNGREPEAFWTTFERVESEYEKRIA